MVIPVLPFMTYAEETEPEQTQEETDTGLRERTAGYMNSELPDETVYTEEPAADEIHSNTRQTAVKLNQDQFYTVNIAYSGDFTWFSFTPDKTGYYYFISGAYNAGVDPYVEMYGDSNVCIASDHNSEGGMSLNFCLNRKLEAGKTYYYKVFLMGSVQTASFPVRISYENMLTVFPDTKTELYVKPGGNVQLRVNVLGVDTSGVIYRWYRNDPAGDYSDELVSHGSTYQAKKIDYVTFITCEVEDRFGNVETVNYTIHPDNGLSVMFDQELRFSTPGFSHGLQAYAEANDTTGLTYMWFYGIKDNNSNYFPVEIAGAHGSYYETQTLNEDARFTVVVRDRYYNEVYANADILIRGQDEVILYNRDVFLPYGQKTQLFASAKGEVAFKTEEPSIASVTSSGLLTGNNVGYTFVWAYEKSKPSNQSGTQVIIGFTDVKDSSAYYFDPVYWAVEWDVTTGHGGPGKFSPNAACTREQVVTFLWRTFGCPAAESHASFTDVKPTDWFYEPVSWAYDKGITTGLNDGTGRFGVGQTCTREMCVTFLQRACMERYKTANVGRYKRFADVEEGRYYFDPISWAYENRITTGLNDGSGKFGVGQKCTRAMIVSFLHRFYLEKIFIQQ